jgi:hypothetical protein
LEARATVNGQSVSKTFVAAILVLVAMGLGAMGGYVAKGLGASGTFAAQSQPVHAAPGTVLRQDNPPKSATQESSSAPIRAIRGGTRGDHGSLP